MLRCVRILLRLVNGFIRRNSAIGMFTAARGKRDRKVTPRFTSDHSRFVRIRILLIIFRIIRIYVRCHIVLLFEGIVKRRIRPQHFNQPVLLNVVKNDRQRRRAGTPAQKQRKHRMRQREFNALQKFPFSLQSDKEDGI